MSRWVGALRGWTTASVVVASLLVVAAPGAARAAPAAPAGWSLDRALVDDGFDAARPSEAGSGYRVWTSSGVQLEPGSGQLDVTGLGPGSSFSLSTLGPRRRDTLLSTTVTASPSGGSYYAGASVRLQPGGSRYAATATVKPGGAVVLTTERVDAGGTTVLARTTTATDAAAAVGAPLRLELQASGSAPTTVQARVWPEGAATPDWQVSGSDSGPGEITAAGGVAVGGYLSRSASTAQVALGSLAVWALAPSTAQGVEPSASPTSAAPSASPTSAAPSASPTSAEPSASPTSAAPPAAVPPASGAPSAFQHPGIVVSAERLAFVRAQVAAGREPWTSALARTRGAWYAKASWVPQPVPQVQCGAYNNPNVGCTAETDDAQAAYTNALLYSLTGERRHADKAIEILDAWSGTLRGHSFDTQLYKNGRLQSAWAAQTFTKAAELIRHSDAGWEPSRVARFEGMLRSAFLPMVRDGWTGGQANWQLSMAEATMNIGVFLDDRAVFEDGVGDWRAQVVSAFYLTTDGPQPVPPLGTYVRPDYVPTYWYQPSGFVDGLGQETCRDLGHTAMGLAAALNAAETAGIQGLDLYTEQRRRLVAAMELTTTYLVDQSAPGWVCPQPPKLGGTAGALTFEVGLRHYGVDGGLPLPRTQDWVAANRPTRSGIFMNWETLTHGS